MGKKMFKYLMRHSNHLLVPVRNCKDLQFSLIALKTNYSLGFGLLSPQILATGDGDCAVPTTCSVRPVC